MFDLSCLTFQMHLNKRVMKKCLRWIMKEDD